MICEYSLVIIIVGGILKVKRYLKHRSFITVQTIINKLYISVITILFQIVHS